jgi:hypothetical protein
MGSWSNSAAQNVIGLSSWKSRSFTLNLHGEPKRATKPSTGIQHMIARNSRGLCQNLENDSEIQRHHSRGDMPAVGLQTRKFALPEVGNTSTSKPPAPYPVDEFGSLAKLQTITLLVVVPDHPGTAVFPWPFRKARPRTRKGPCERPTLLLPPARETYKRLSPSSCQDW